MQLYKQADKYRELAEKLEDMDQQTIIDTLEGSAELMAIEEKTVGIIQMVKNWESDLPGYEAEIKRLTENKKAIENRIKSVKEYLKDCLQRAGLEKIKVGVHSARLQKNSRGAVNVYDSEVIPAKYIDIIPEQHVPNNDRLYQDLKIGVEVPGVNYEIGNHVRIS